METIQEEEKKQPEEEESKLPTYNHHKQQWTASASCSHAHGADAPPVLITPTSSSPPPQSRFRQRHVPVDESTANHHPSEVHSRRRPRPVSPGGESESSSSSSLCSPDGRFVATTTPTMTRPQAGPTTQQQPQPQETMPNSISLDHWDWQWMVVDELVSRLIWYAPTSRKAHQLVALWNVASWVRHVHVTRRRRQGSLQHQLQTQDSSMTLLTSLGSTSKIVSRLEQVCHGMLQVMHCVVPALERFPDEADDATMDVSHSHYYKRLQQVQRIRVVARLGLIALHHYQAFQQQQQQQQIPAVARSNDTDLAFGILRQRGTTSREEDGTNHIPTLQEELVRKRHARYVGRRTGRRLGGPSPNHNRIPPCVEEESFAVVAPVSSESRKWAALVLGEWLHVYRPLFWATANLQKKKPWNVWMVGLAMDVLSQRLVQYGLSLNGSGGSKTTTTTNASSQEEWNRRRWQALWLAALKRPVFPMELISRVLQKVPLVGQYLSHLIWHLHHNHELLNE
mmetsp:Transcript_7339/g.13193  ORF Transcript_7339/g.13193 Transcript_7339/m.13193 type:complete len:510 (-) Transcript_7339:182-1711(-)